MALSKEDIVSWRGRDLAASDGSKLGSIDEIYLDQETREPEWALINTGLFGTKQTFVPLRNASPAEDTLRVPYDKDQVKDAPRIDADGELSQSERLSCIATTDLSTPRPPRTPTAERPAASATARWAGMCRGLRPTRR